jgi:hypothetical protein
MVTDSLFQWLIRTMAMLFDGVARSHSNDGFIAFSKDRILVREIVVGLGVRRSDYIRSSSPQR